MSTTPNDAAQPVAKIRVAGGDRSTVMWITDSPPTTPILVYTATDYDKLREEVERLREQNEKLRQELKDQANYYVHPSWREGCEAAEARLARLVELGRQVVEHDAAGELSDKVMNEFADALNEQGESNG